MRRLDFQGSGGNSQQQGRNAGRLSGNMVKDSPEEEVGGWVDTWMCTFLSLFSVLIFSVVTGPVSILSTSN